MPGKSRESRAFLGVTRPVDCYCRKSSVEGAWLCTRSKGQMWPVGTLKGLNKSRNELPLMECGIFFLVPKRYGDFPTFELLSLALNNSRLNPRQVNQWFCRYERFSEDTNKSGTRKCPGG